ncbi:MAG TPA: hypothetical protein VNG90_04875 [Candidatus Acidoferrum sp.]|nr:hypothetical protein [Candidatus Acidoferrum sp.]
MSTLVFATFPFLNQQDTITIRQVLADAEPQITGKWLLGGSNGYRLLLPSELGAHSLANLNLVVYPKPGQSCLELVAPGIKNNFYVTHIDRMGRGYYFGMVHKTSGLWVDIFTPEHTPSFVPVVVAGQAINVESIPETLYAILRDLLWRQQRGMLIRASLVEAAALLWKYVDHDQLYRIFAAHPGEYQSLVPADIAKTPEAITAHALTIAPFKPADWSPQPSYPTDCINTENGITIEPPDQFALATQLHLSKRING